MTQDNFNEMTESALLNVDETLTQNTEKQEPENPYKLTQGLLQLGHYYDNNGVYIHFKETYQRIGVDVTDNKFKTMDNIYLFITRNPDKKLELNLEWKHKVADGFTSGRAFNIDFLLNTGDDKEIKTLNQRVANSGRRNHNPASEGTYVEFVEYLTDLITVSPCLEVFKQKDYVFPEPVEETSEDVENTVQHPQNFSEYPEKVQHEALEILENGSLFEETQKSVSLTHEGHETTRDALILMESSPIVDDGAQGLLGGDSGEGKTDLALACAMNLPQKHVHIISSNSPKDIFYDFEKYDDDFNILIFDDVLMTEELIKLIKLLADNKIKEKIHKTVINGKAVEFKLKGKYEIILTYAKTVPDEELANRLFNIGVNIVDKNKSKGRVKRKILNNKIIRADDNPLIKDIREPIRAGVQYLIEQKPRIYNPYLSVFDPLNINNRDINHLESMISARTFYDCLKRQQIKINDETVLTIGSAEDVGFVYNIWARDEEAQAFKLSERQKQVLDILPEMTDQEAFDYVEKLNDELKTTQSRATKKKMLDNEPLLKSLAKQLKINPATLRHVLDRFNEGNQKSLCEIGLVEKIKLDEDKDKSPNFYYKVKKDGAPSKSELNNRQDVQIEFAHDFNTPIVKSIIIINLLIYANIVVSKRGYTTLEKYCKDKHVELNAKDYNTVINFLNGFFDTINHDKDLIKYEDSTREDKLAMLNYQADLFEKLESNSTTPSPADECNLPIENKSEENAQNGNRGKNKSANANCTSNESTTSNSAEKSQKTNPSKNRCAKHDLPFKIFSDEIRAEIEKMHIDVEIACDTYNFLKSNEKATTQDIVNYIFETVNPDDFNSETTPLKIGRHLTLMSNNDLLELKSNEYMLTQDFINLVQGGE